MSEINKYLPTEGETVKAIFDHWKEVGDANQYDAVTLGAGQIGHPCARYLWYTFRHCCRSSFDGRMYRLFDRGNLEEPRIVADLEAIGCTVHTHTVKGGEQFRVVALGGHVSGYLDGAVLGLPEAPKTWHVLEVKTHNAKSYTKLKKQGVKLSLPKHYAQMMIYMHLSEMKRALYVAVNKDTEELHVERIRYDAEEAKALLNRARDIITSTSPPERIGGRPDYYQCKYCDANLICYGGQSPHPTLCVPSLSCRQCCHATPKTLLDDIKAGGRWVCEKRSKALSYDEQKKACEDHLTLPGLLALQEAYDYGKDAAGNEYIRFRHDKWGEWQHGKGGFSSKELRRLPMEILSNDMITTAKEKFGAKVDDHPEDLLDKYPEKCLELIWRGKLDANDISEAFHAKYKTVPSALTPTARCNFDTHSVAEYEYGKPKWRILIVAYPSRQRAEIWEAK